MQLANRDDNNRVEPTLRKIGYILLVLLSAVVLPAFGQGYTLSRTGDITPPFPDNAQVRRVLYDKVVSAVSDLSYARDDYFPLSPGTGSVHFSVETQNDSLYILFINELEGSYPLYSAGSYIIKRSLVNGLFLQIKVFYKNDAGSFIRIFPIQERANMDVFLAGVPLYSGINLPGSFESYLDSSFEDILSLTRNIVEWELLLPEYSTDAFRDIYAMVDTIRERIPSLTDADDGAMNSSGEYVSIATGEPLVPGGLNCSGFVKWVIDGLYAPITGGYLDLEDLKRRHTDERGNRWSRRREYERDPYFGLDWTRNLAMELEAIRSGGAGKAEDFDFDNAHFREYREDIGYAISDLPLILYEQAVRDPGNFYLGSVNGAYGNEPVLRQHYHIAVFFPVLDANGCLKVFVFERNRETSLDTFIGEYPGAYVHLVSLRASDNFDPPLPR